MEVGSADVTTPSAQLNSSSALGLDTKSIFSLKIPPKISKYPQKFLKIPKYPKT